MRGFIKAGIFTLIALFVIFYFIVPPFFTTSYSSQNSLISSAFKAVLPPPTLDKVLYDRLMEKLANNPPTLSTSTASSTSSGIATSSDATEVKKKNLWPATAPYPNVGAILPFNRIVAYYGNFYSKAMGALGEYEPDIMLQKLMNEVEKWELADPETPVIPAIHYIVTTAQGCAEAIREVWNRGSVPTTTEWQKLCDAVTRLR